MGDIWSDDSIETHQNVIDEAKEQDQSQQKERQAKGDPQHRSSTTHTHGSI